MAPLVIGDDSAAITQLGDESAPRFLTGAQSVDQHKRLAIAAVVSDRELCTLTLEPYVLHPYPPIRSDPTR